MKFFTFKRTVAFILAVIVSSLLCCALYLFDNKYTRKETQPALGLLVLSQRDVDTAPLRFLTRGWALYPNVLLSPEDFEEKDPQRYMIYTMIGERTRFDFGGKNPHGCATYVLHLELPQVVNTYALELPEIFSAYRLYVNKNQLYGLGNPNPSTYQSATKNTVVTFEASGKTTLILAVSDFSHLYSGLNYPPAFGKPQAVAMARDTRLGVRLIAATAAFMAGMLAFYLGLKRRHSNALLFALLCLFTCSFSAYPILHGAFALPIFPWYALEIFCYYAVSGLVIFLHNRLCKVSKPLRLISSSAAFIFCLFMFTYALLSEHLTVPVMDFVSHGAFVFKLLVGVYLIIVSVQAIGRFDQETLPLFYAAVIYAVAFTWDRFLPLYEPVIGGWFTETASFIFIFAIGYLLWRDIVRGYGLSFALAEEHRQITRQLNMQMEYSRQMMQQAEEINRQTHDFRQHLRTISSMAEKTGQEQILQYVHHADEAFISAGAAVSFCENPGLDALIRYYFSVAKNAGIDIRIRLSLPNLPLNDIELCTVAGNLLENAIEACNRQPGGEKAIALTGRTDGNSLFLLIENTFDGIIHKKNEEFLSLKSATPRVGIGLMSVRKIIDRYGGTLDILTKNNKFAVGLSWPFEPDRQLQDKKVQ